MAFFTHIINNFLLIFVSLILFLIVIYLLLPWFFDKLVSPKFNATYRYNPKDFKKKDKIEPFLSQFKIENIEFNKSNGQYIISFGKRGQLINGIVKVRNELCNYFNNNPLKEKSKTLKLLSINEETGNDKLGNFKSIYFQYRLEDIEQNVNVLIKNYHSQNFITFELSIPDGLDNSATGKYSELITSFPSFINLNSNMKTFTFRNAIFCPPTKKFNITSAPVLFYDDDLNCFIISPLDSFLNTAISKDENNRISCGIQGAIKKIPKNFTQKFILLFDKGINQSIEHLGNILLKYHNSERKSLYANVVTSYLGFWTDNGAYYYYKTEKGMNYEDTMVSIKNYFEENNIPIVYYNFDSWWYLKHTNKLIAKILKPLIRLMGGGLFGNTLRWEVDPKNFLTDLKTFHQNRFQKPITAHNRRWDARSPYVEKFEFETYKNHAIPLKKEFWEWLMKHARESGIEVYEQDWMKNQIVSIPLLRKNFNAQEEWLSSMATAAKEQGIDVYYCMQTPGLLLYSIKHSNINISRCSGDYNPRWPISYRFVHSTQTNILFNAIGINSHPDVFRSRTIENVKFRPFGERFPDFQCLYQILNAGVIAPGDKKENINWPLLKKTCRDDGLLLKPDKSLTANDLMFKKHRKYYICDTYTKINNLIWRYIFITNIWPNRVKEKFFSLKELGYEKSEYILFDFLSGDIQRVNIDNSIEIGKLHKYEYKYFILCPITASGMALIGCPDKFVTCSKKLIKKFTSTEDSISTLIENIKGSIVKLLIYSEKKPSSIQVDHKSLNTWIYNELSKIIALTLKFEASGKKEILIQKK
ncbi:MAG: hypothetical protein ACFE9I_07045 [Candidatus Hermodarchaeota archaeon]